MKQSQDLKLARITPDTLIIGIDVAKRTHWARMINYQGSNSLGPSVLIIT
jgi:hypothetical protein